MKEKKYILKCSESNVFMTEELETKLIECHIEMSEAIKGFNDRAFQSNKLFDIRQYRNKLPKEIYQKIENFVNENILPMVYDVDYWSCIEKNEMYGSYDNNNHFIVDSVCSLECIIFRKNHHVYDLLQKLSDFMSEEFQLNYD